MKICGGGREGPRCVPARDRLCRCVLLAGYVSLGPRGCCGGWPLAHLCTGWQVRAWGKGSMGAPGALEEVTVVVEVEDLFTRCQKGT